MKKNLRMLCLGLAAATFTCGFAQEDYTNKLTNADMELASQGWGFEGEKVLGKNTKNPATQTGFYGMNKGVLEAWNANPETPLGNSYIMQRLNNLPSGTYVFGAYVGAAKQTRNQTASNCDTVVGVKLFANEASVPVATNNPDLNHKYDWAHSAKFNVAVTLTDTAKLKGYLDAGLRVQNTTANYVVWDNATLYYFGKMSEEDALNAMAKIDVEKAVAIADTLKTIHMHTDSLTALTAAIDAAGKAEITAENFNELLNSIFWTAGRARKSAADYTNLKNNIESATAVVGGVWRTDLPVIAGLKNVLSQKITAAEAAYADKAMNRADITALRKELNWAAGDLKYDSLLIAQNNLQAFTEEAQGKEGQAGGYSKQQIESLKGLYNEVRDTMAVLEAELELYMGGELEFADRTFNPNNLYPYIARIYTTIENVKNNPISLEYTKMPIEFKPSKDVAYNVQGSDCKPIEGSVVTSDNLVEFVSPMYRFQGNIETFRITIKKAAAGQHFFCLSELAFYDNTGAPITLTEENITSNACHITLNPGSEGAEGNGIPALVDGDVNTFFHSDWSGKVNNEYHYLEVALPNGGYDAFSFKMISRGQVNASGQQTGGQRHTFPGEMVISTPAPKRDALEALEALVNQAKNLNAYSFPEVGYYVTDFSALNNTIVEAEAMVANYASESDCETMLATLAEAIAAFEASEDKAVRLPEAGKQYRIISGFPGYFEKQGVEKALTVHTDTIKSLWWENVCADSLQQFFVLDPIMNADGEHSIVTNTGTNDDGTSWVENLYHYTIKNVATGLYVDSAFNNNKVCLVEQREVPDTVVLKWLGRGQWNIMLKGEVLHCGDHNSGNVGGANGAYGGTWGVSSGICAYPGGLDGASAWYILEYPTLPLEVAVEGAEFKSEFIRFEAANTITLTADKDCAFADLALYDRYGAAIAIDSLVVSGKTATIIQKSNLAACAFAFTNAEGVAKVEFNADWIDPVSVMDYLQEAYDAAVAINPIVGDAVGQVADISEYTAALEAAEAMLELGSATDEEIEKMVERLDTIANVLVVNMPEDGKYYFLYNAVEAFENKFGYKMTLYINDALTLSWAHENLLDWNRYWQFERATEEDLEAVGMATDACAFYIKNVANGMYIADGAQSAQVGVTDDKDAALPYVVTLLGSGVEVALDGLGQSGKRIHANGHGGGANSAGNIVYWGSGAGTASAWNIVETQYDVTDIDFTEVETEKAVVKGTYDLFGRRVAAPTAPGIYIIDGRKKLVK